MYELQVKLEFSEGRGVESKNTFCGGGKDILFYDIKTNEIPGELLCENMISPHVKRSLLLWLHNKSCLL